MILQPQGTKGNMFFLRTIAKETQQVDVFLKSRDSKGGSHFSCISTKSCHFKIQLRCNFLKKKNLLTDLDILMSEALVLFAFSHGGAAPFARKAKCCRNVSTTTSAVVTDTG